MLKVYELHKTIWVNGQKISIGDSLWTGGHKMSEEPPATEFYNINWNNLSCEEHRKKLIYPFNIRKKFFGKGRVVTVGDVFFDDSILTLKEGRDPLDITIKYEWKEITPSMQTILKWHNAEEAIQYLKERECEAWHWGR